MRNLPSAPVVQVAVASPAFHMQRGSGPWDARQGENPTPGVRASPCALDGPRARTDNPRRMARPTNPRDRATRGTPVVLLGALSAMGPLTMDLYLPGLPRMADDLGDGGVARAAHGHRLPARPRRSVSSSPARSATPGAAAGRCSSASSPTASPRRCARWRRRCGRSSRCGSCRGWRAPRASSSRARWCATGTRGVEAARFFALLMLVNGLAPILAPLIGGGLLQVTTWRGIFVVLAGVGAVLAVATATGCRETLAPRASPHRRPADHDAPPSASSCTTAPSSATRSRRGSRSPRCSPTSPARRSCCRTSTALSPQLFSVVFGANALGIVVAEPGQRRAGGAGRPAPAARRRAVRQRRRRRRPAARRAGGARAVGPAAPAVGGRGQHRPDRARTRPRWPCRATATTRAAPRR